MQIFCTLVGANFRGKPACDIIRSLELSDGSSLKLEAEPTNEYDANAVKVLYEADGDEEHLGYIAKVHNEPVARALEAGAEIEIEIVAFESNLKPVLQLTFDGE